MSLAKIAPYAKAVMAGAIAAAGAVATGYADEVLSTGEIWAAVSAGLAAGGATWAIPNAARKAAAPVPADGQSGIMRHDVYDHPNGVEDYQEPQP